MVVLFFAFTYYVTAATTIITVTAPPAATPTSTTYTSDSDFKSSMLAAHNFYRGEHNASDLSWNDTSAEFAANWAKPCVFKHSGGPTGENLAAGFVNVSASVEAWGLEREKYNFNKPGFSEQTGHFTQLVWRDTTSVGCGRQNCNGENGTPGWYVVCEYYPPGNVIGDNNQFFIDNVKPQIKGEAGDTIETGVTGVTGVTGGGTRRFGVGWLSWLIVVAAAVDFAL